MTSFCIVPECPGSTRGKQRGEKIGFFRVQVDQVLEWSNLIPGNVKLTVNDRLCSRHFEDEDIIKDWVFEIDGEKVTMPRGRWTLKVGAVPKIFGCYKDDYKPRTPRKRAVPTIDLEEPSSGETPRRIRKRKPKPTHLVADNSSEGESHVPHKKPSKNPTPVLKTYAKAAKRLRDADDRSNPWTNKTGSEQGVPSFYFDGSLCSGFLSGTETTLSVSIEDHRVSDVEKDAFDGSSDRTVVPSLISTSCQIPSKIVVKKEECDKGCRAHDLEAHCVPEHSPESTQQVQEVGWDYEGVVVKREMCDCDAQCSLPMEECEHNLHPTTVIFDEELSQAFEGSQHEHEDLPCSPSLIEENGVTLKFSMPESVTASSKFSFIDLEEQAFKPSTAQINTVPISRTQSLGIERNSGISAADIIIHDEETQTYSSRCGTSLEECHESGPVLDQTCSTSTTDCDKLAIEIPLPEITITPVVAACSNNDENPGEIDKSMPSDQPDFSIHGNQVGPGVTRGSTISDFQLQIEPVERPDLCVLPPIDIQNRLSVSELPAGFVERPLQLDTLTTGSKELEKTIKTSEINFENGAKKLEQDQYSDDEMDFLGFESDEDEALVEKRKHFQNSSDMAVKSAKTYFDKLPEKCKSTANEAVAVDSKIFSDPRPQAQPNVDEPTVRKAIEQLKELAPRTSSLRKKSKPSNRVNVKPGHHKKKSVMKNVATALEKASMDIIKNDLARKVLKPEIKNSKISRASNCVANASKNIIKDDSARKGMKSGSEDRKIPCTPDCGENTSKEAIKNDSARNGMRSGFEDRKIPRTSDCGENALKDIIENELVRNGKKSGFEDSKIPCTSSCGENTSKETIKNDLVRNGKKSGFKDSKILRTSNCGENTSKETIKNDSARNGMKSGFEDSKIPRTSNCGENASKGIKNDLVWYGKKSGFEDSKIPRTSDGGANTSKDTIKNDSARNGMKSSVEDSKIPLTLKCGQLKNVTISSNPPQRPVKSIHCSENIVTAENMAASPSHQISHKRSPIMSGQTSLDRIWQAANATTPSPNHRVVHKGILPIKSSLDRILQAADASASSQIFDPAADKTSLILKNFRSDGVLALECVVLREQVRRLQKELFLQKQLLVDSEHNASLLQRKLELQSQLPCPKCATFRPVIGRETLI